MKMHIIALAAATIIASAPIAFAQNAGTSSAPGQQMQDKGSVVGSPGASGYAPGHLKKKHVRAHKVARHHVAAKHVRETTGMATQDTTTKKKIQAR